MPWRTRSSYTEDPDSTTTSSARSGSARTMRNRASGGPESARIATSAAAATVTRSARRRFRTNTSGRQPLRKGADDAFCGMAVPQLRDARRECSRRHDVVNGCTNALRIEADHAVGAVRDRDRTLGVLPERQAWHAEDGCFFLDAAGIGQHEPRVIKKGQEIEISERFNDRRTLAERIEQPEFLQFSGASRMQGHDNLQAFGELSDGLQRPLRVGARVDIARAVQRAGGVLARTERKTAEHCAPLA